MSTNPAPDPCVRSLTDWLTGQGLGDPDAGGLFAGCCMQLCEAGIPLWRGHVSFRTLHPLFEAKSLTWTHGTGLENVGLPHTEGPPRDVWRRSPLFHVIENRLPGLRRRLTGDGAEVDFPFLEDLRDRGATDYLAFCVPFDAAYETGLVGSWATQTPGGFSEAHLDVLGRIKGILALALKVKIQDLISRDVVTTYLGPRTGAQVLGGTIKRGDGEAIDAVVWYSDLRRSTELIRQESVESFLTLLNRYFDCTAGAVRAHGGEVITLAGDAVLAVFRAGAEGALAAPSYAAAGARAVAAAREATARLDEVNRGLAAIAVAPLRFGLALHLGTVIHGNIGTSDRLEFTVVGPAVNEAVRIESLSKTLGQTVLASAAFADTVAGPWRSLGRHPLRGVTDEAEIFALEPRKLEIGTLENGTLEIGTLGTGTREAGR